MARRLILLAIATLAGCGDSTPEFWGLPGANNSAMIIPEDADPDALPALAKEHCGAAQQCGIFGWRDAAIAPRSLPMTDREAAAQLFSYALNRETGFEQSLWNCKVYPRRSADECLAPPEAAKAGP